METPYSLVMYFFLIKAVALQYLHKASMNGSGSGIPIYFCEQTFESPTFRGRKLQSLVQGINPEFCLILLFYFYFSLSSGQLQLPFNSKVLAGCLSGLDF